MFLLYGPGNPLTAQDLQKRSADPWAGHEGSQSDTIKAIFIFLPIPKPNGRRQINLVGLSGTEYPLPGSATQQRNFHQSDQPIAAEARRSLRRFESIDYAGRSGRPEMATLSHFFASLPYGVLFGSRPTQPAVSMAKTEV